MHKIHPRQLSTCGNTVKRGEDSPSVRISNEVADSECCVDVEMWSETFGEIAFINIMFAEFQPYHQAL